MLKGTLACVNAFGTGVADDKLMHAYVEQMVRFYLGEEPILKSVPTYDPTQPGVLEMVLERIGELVIKPRTGHGGHGVVIGPHAKAEDLKLTAAALKHAPELYIAQETVMLSRHPTVTEGRLELTAHRPAPVRDLERRERARAAGRADPRGLRARGAGRQLLAERRQQGHMGAGVSPMYSNCRLVGFVGFSHAGRARKRSLKWASRSSG